MSSVLAVTEIWLHRCGDKVIIGRCPPGYRFVHQPRLNAGWPRATIENWQLNVETREDKGDSEGIPGTHPIP